MKTLLLHPTDYRRLQHLEPMFEDKGYNLAEDNFGVRKAGFGWGLPENAPPAIVPPPKFKYRPLAFPELPRIFWDVTI